MKRLNKEEKNLLEILEKARCILVNQRSVLFDKRQEFCNGIINREIEFNCIAEDYEGEDFKIDICDDGARYLLEQNHELQLISRQLGEAFNYIFKVMTAIDPDLIERRNKQLGK